MKVSVSQTINCAHQLPRTELHGHTYRVIVIAESFLGVDGRAIPFEDLRRELERIAYKVDHRQLETVIGEPATAERLALWFRDQFSRRPLTVRVEVGDGGWVETE